MTDPAATGCRRWTGTVPGGTPTDLIGPAAILSAPQLSDTLDPTEPVATRGGVAGMAGHAGELLGRGLG